MGSPRLPSPWASSRAPPPGRLPRPLEPGSPQVRDSERVSGERVSYFLPTVSKVTSGPKFCCLLHVIGGQGCCSWPDGGSRRQDIGVGPGCEAQGQWRWEEAGCGAEAAPSQCLPPECRPHGLRRVCTNSVPCASVFRKEQKRRASRNNDACLLRPFCARPQINLPGDCSLLPPDLLLGEWAELWGPETMYRFGLGMQTGLPF